MLLLPRHHLCHSTVPLELGLWPMPLWSDKRLLEFWHRVRTMPASRLVTQVVFAGTGTQAAGRRRAPRQHTWLDHVGEALQEWGIDPSRTERMNYPQFKRLLHKTLPAVWARRLEAERASRPTLDAYRRPALRRSSPPPRAYLCWAGAGMRPGHGACSAAAHPTRPLAHLTGKLGRRRRDDRYDTVRNSMCPVCSSAVDLWHFSFLTAQPTVKRDYAGAVRRGVG
jgi:hypothetical protein